ncbi:MAG: cupredoxin domain-containing protein [Archangium sp.]|nr:cupredoxin domain-containing protein [Archangium sp.]
MRTLLGLTLLFLTLPGCKKDQAAITPAVETAKPAGTQKTVVMSVTDEGFVPSNVTVKANEPVTLVITRKTEETCATEILIDGTDIKTALPLNQAVEVAWTPTRAGAVKFGCAMDKMIGGVLLVE